MNSASLDKCRVGRYSFAMKLCNGCGETKPLDQFHNDRSKKDGKKTKCAQCVRTQHANWRAANPEIDKRWAKENPDRMNFLHTRRRADPKHKASYAFSQRKSDIKARYKLDWETYTEMSKDGCWSCGSKKDLQVDHDHSCCPGRVRTCGKCVRGILCGDCNAAESRLKTAERALALAVYMSRVDTSAPAR